MYIDYRLRYPGPRRISRASAFLVTLFATHFVLAVSRFLSFTLIRSSSSPSYSMPGPCNYHYYYHCYHYYLVATLRTPQASQAPSSDGSISTSGSSCTSSVYLLGRAKL